MHAFADSPPIKFQFNVVDVCTMLHLPVDGIPFHTTRSPGVTPNIIPTIYTEYSDCEGWHLI